MTSTSFFIIKAISFIVFVYNLASSDWSNLSRVLLFIISFFVFLLVTNVYQRKVKIVTLGYLVYFFLAFLAQNVGPYAIIYNSHIQNLIQRFPNICVPNDHYTLYFLIFIFVSTVIYIYLLCIDKISIEQKVWVYMPTRQEARKIMMAFFIILLPIWILGNMSYATILVPFTSYFIISIWKYPFTRKIVVFIIGFIASVLILISQLFSRFIFVQYVFPFILIWFLNNGLLFSRKEKISYKVIGFFLLFCSLAILYGIISEMMKLNANFDGNYTFNDMFEVLSEPQLLQNWLSRQTYRIFDIWSHLGGNIIDYIDQKGYLWGITYVKSFAPILGFDYVSLPLISANMIGADYAQPGLVAEGYANWGIYGAIINMIFVFFVAELLFDYFLRKQSTLNLLLYIGTFSQVLLDGGTINSIIFMSIFCFLTCLFNAKIKF